MKFWLWFIFILILHAKTTIAQEEEEADDNNIIHPKIDLLLYELDNVVDDGELKSIPDDLIHKCQLALALWSIDGRENINRPPSTSEDYANADRLMNKLKQTHLVLGGDELDPQGFVRDIFFLDYQWFVSAVQYYTFIKYYDNDPLGPSSIYKLIEWTIDSMDSTDDFPPKYHLERSYSQEFGYTYMLGRKISPHYHESLINFGNYCPSYMELKTFIIGDITGEMSLDALISSGYLD